MFLSFDLHRSPGFAINIIRPRLDIDPSSLMFDEFLVGVGDEIKPGQDIAKSLR